MFLLFCVVYYDVAFPFFSSRFQILCELGTGCFPHFLISIIKENMGESGGDVSAEDKGFLAHPREVSWRLKGHMGP